MKLNEREIESLDSLQKIKELIDNDPYADSPFRELKALSSKRKGAWFERIVESILRSKGYIVEKPSHTDHDRIVNGLKMEIKGSFMWGSSEGFRWQQIRSNQDYDFICFLAVYPYSLDLKGAPKSVVLKEVATPTGEGLYIHNQHGGKTKNSGTYFIQGPIKDFPWLEEVEDVIERLSK